MKMKCPVCASDCRLGPERDYGERQKFACQRCGRFEITRTALSMLGSRLLSDGLVTARLSHAIRTSQREDEWLQITSTNLDPLLRTRLPGIAGQLTNLIHWASAILGDNKWGMIKLDSLDKLAGVVGTVDANHVNRLLEYAVNEGLVGFQGSILSITPSGWRFEELDKIGDKEALDVQSAQLPASPPTTAKPTESKMRSHCNKCGPDRQAVIQATFTKEGADGETSWSETGYVLECAGCQSVSLRHEFWFSEWDQIEDNPTTGLPVMVPGIKVTIWPPPAPRKKPAWVTKLKDAILRDLLDELYSAVETRLHSLATAGVRTVLDRAMFLRVGDIGGFEAKLKKMTDEKIITPDEKDALIIVTDAGSAAAHRGYKPDVASLETILASMETYLQRDFVLRNDVSAVKQATPSRPPKS